MMTILNKILDTIQPPRGLTKDELRAFRRSLIPTNKCKFPVKGRIERSEAWVELCIRPMDLARWRFNLAEHGLANNPIIADLLTAMGNNPDLMLRFRHANSATSFPKDAPARTKSEPRTMTSSGRG